MLPNDGALELSEPTKNLEDHPAAGRARVEPLGQAAEVHATLSEAGHDVDQVPQRPAQPVEADHHERVAGPQVVEHPVQLGPAVQRTGRGLGPHPHTTRILERGHLALGGLLTGADAGGTRACCLPCPGCRTNVYWRHSATLNVATGYATRLTGLGKITGG